MKTKSQYCQELIGQAEKVSTNFEQHDETTSLN